MTFPSIVFSDNASNSWEMAVQRLTGFVVELRREQGGPTETVVVQGVGRVDDGWETLLYRAYDEDAPGDDWPATGPVLSIRTDQFIEMEVC